MGTRINLDYQVDNSQFDGKVKDNIKEPGSGVSRLEVVNVGGDTMTGELKLPTLTFNSVNSADVAQVFGSQAGAISTLHIRYGKNADDEFQIEFYNGSTASAVLHVDGNKDMTNTVRDLTVNSSRDIDLNADNDINLTSPACTITSSTINFVQNNNKINVSSNKWRFTNDGTNYYYMQEGLPIGTVLMYHGAGIANVATRTEDIGARGGDTIKLTGWKVCNSYAGTPNLLNKFVRCQTSSGATGGSDNGVATHNHTSQIQSTNHHHNHDHANKTSTGPSDNTTDYMSANAAHSHLGGTPQWDYYNNGIYGRYDLGYTSTVSPSGYHTRRRYLHYTSSTNTNHTHTMKNHTHDVNLPDTASGNQSDSHSHTIDDNGTSGGNMPAYFSLIFIIKMS